MLRLLRKMAKCTERHHEMVRLRGRGAEKAGGVRLRKRGEEAVRERE